MCLCAKHIFYLINHLFTNDCLVSIDEEESEEEVKKKTRSFQKSQKWSLECLEVVLRPYDEIKKCSDCHPESSHMGKNSSRRTPRPKNLILVVF